MNDLYSLLHRNYEATVKRGQITNKTTLKDFIAKLKEEIAELEGSIDEDENSFDDLELVDCFLVCASALIDLRSMRFVGQKVLINEKRAKDSITLQEAVTILDNHNQWRRGIDGFKETNPTRLGLAIDIITKHLKQ